MNLEHIKDSLEVAQSKADEGIVSMCNSFLERIFPGMDSGGICSVVGEFEDKIKDFLDDLHIVGDSFTD